MNSNLEVKDMLELIPNTDITKTLNKLANNLGKPTYILIPPGNFYISDTVILNENTKLKGHGHGITNIIYKPYILDENSNKNYKNRHNKPCFLIRNHHINEYVNVTYNYLTENVTLEDFTLECDYSEMFPNFISKNQLEYILKKSYNVDEINDNFIQEKLSNINDIKTIEYLKNILKLNKEEIGFYHNDNLINTIGIEGVDLNRSQFSNLEIKGFNTSLELSNINGSVFNYTAFVSCKNIYIKNCIYGIVTGSVYNAWTQDYCDNPGANNTNACYFDYCIVTSFEFKVILDNCIKRTTCISNYDENNSNKNLPPTAFWFKGIGGPNTFNHCDAEAISIGFLIEKNNYCKMLYIRTESCYYDVIFGSNSIGAIGQEPIHYTGEHLGNHQLFERPHKNIHSCRQPKDNYRYYSICQLQHL